MKWIQSLPKQRWRQLLALLVIYYPSLVASSPSAGMKAKSVPAEETQNRPKIWGMLPKVETVPFKADFGSQPRPKSKQKPTSAIPKRMIVMGGPASGKGTQCQAIAEKYGLVHLSTGDILRQIVSSDSSDDERSPHVSTIKRCMEEGKLIPDDIVVRLVLDRLSAPDCQRRGWILDGFPRTSNQARALQGAGIHPDLFLLLSVPDEVAIKRVVGRRQDPVTGKVYHLDWNPPPNDIVHRLVVRSDDTVESMQQRLKQFWKNVKSVKGCYNNVVEIDGLGTPDDVFRDIDSTLKICTQVKH